MSWTTTIHQKRSILVKELCLDTSSFCVRGNIVWAVLDNNLVAYEIKKNNRVWEYKKINEPQFTEDHLSCPAGYLDISKEQNHEWRELLKKNLEVNKNLKQQIESAFKEAQNSKRRLIIIVKTKTKGNFELEVEKLVPLLGRNRDGKLYQIPIRRISSWQIK